MPWQVFILINVIFISFRAILTRALAVRNPDKHGIFALNAAAMTVLYLFGLVYVSFHYVDVSAALKYWPYLLAGGTLYAITNALMLKLFSYVDSAAGTVIGTFSVLFTSLFAWLLIDERLTTLQAVGAILLLPSVCYVVLLNRKKSKVRKTWQVIGIALAYTVIWGLANTNEKYILNHLSIPTYICFGWGAQAAMSWVLAFMQPSHLKILKKRSLWKLTFGIGALTAVAGITYIEALVKSNSVALISAVTCFRLIIVAILGWLLLHERRDFWRKLVVSAIAAIGVLLMVI